MQIHLFDNVQNDNNIKFGSPSKNPLKNKMADPEYKPFDEEEEIVSQNCSNSHLKGNLSEDDSPKRRKMIKSPTKKQMECKKRADLIKFESD